MKTSGYVWIPLVVWLGACGSEEHAAHPPPAPAAETLALVELERSAWLVDGAREGALVVGWDAIRHESSAEPLVGLQRGAVPASEKPGGANGFLITRLMEALRAHDERDPSLAIAFDPRIPFRTVSEVLYTAGQAERDDYRLLARQAGQVRALPIALPRLGQSVDGDHDAEMMLLGALGGEGALADVLGEGALDQDRDDIVQAPPPAAPVRDDPSAGSAPRTGPALTETRASLHLTITVTAEGMIVTSIGGKVRPGCTETGSGHVITVPVVDGQQDRGGLAACLRRISREYPDEERLIVTADPEVTFGELARVIATTRGTEAAPLFPTTWISAGVR